MTFLESAIQLCALLWASPARCISPPALYRGFSLRVAFSWQHCVYIMQSDLLSSIPHLSPLLPARLLCSRWHGFAWEFLFAWVWEEWILLGCSESAGFEWVLPPRVHWHRSDCASTRPHTRSAAGAELGSDFGSHGDFWRGSCWCLLIFLWADWFRDGSRVILMSKPGQVT